MSNKSKGNDTPHETVAKFLDITKYDEYLENTKEDRPNIQKWLKKKKKFLLVYGGTNKDRENILDYFWVKVGELIPDQYPIIVWKKMDCSNKSDNELEEKIFYQTKQTLIDYLNTSNFQNDFPYYTIKDPIKHLRKEYLSGIKAVLKKYKKYGTKYHDFEVKPCLEKRFLSLDEKEVYNNCKVAFKCIEEYKKLLLLDLLDYCFHTERCNVLFLHNISSKNINMWKDLRAELLNPTSIYKYDLIFATAEEESDIKRLPKTFKDMFEVIHLSEKDSKVEDVEEKDASAHSPSQEEPKDNYIFRKDGERWYIEFENELLKPEDSDGLKYIHYLMEHHYQKSITPKKLYRAVKGIKTLDKDVDNSLKTYSVKSKEVDGSTLEELKKSHGSSSDKSRISKSKMTQFEKEHEIYTKGEIKMIVEGWKKKKETIKNKAAELKEEGRFSEAEEKEKEIKDKQKQIDTATRQEHDTEHKQFYDMVYKAIDNAKKKIKILSAKESYKSLLIWNHLEDSIDYKGSHYSYNPKKPIGWEF